MLVLFSENQYFVQFGGHTGEQGWSFDIEDATLFYEDGFELLIELVNQHKDYRCEIRNMLGDTLYTNLDKEDRINTFLN